MRKSIIYVVLLCLFAIEHSHAQQNVGIGNSSPLMRLHVTKNDSAVALLENTQGLATGISNALYFKVGSYYTGAIKTIGEASAYSSMGFYTYATGNANSLHQQMLIKDDGDVTINNNLGIGADPTYRLDINGRMLLRYNGNTAGFWLNKADNSNEAAFVGNYNDTIYGIYTNTGGGWQFFFDHKNGYLGMNNSSPKVGISFPASIGKKISLYPGASGDAGMDVWGNEFRLHSDYSGADITFGYDNYISGFTERMRVKGDGRVCIGTTSPATGYLLSVYGKVVAEEVRVQLKASWPDYVFADNYELPPLTGVKEFIRANQHLPGLPAAAEIEKNGLDLGDMQKKMVEKIEQLTLYVIDMQQQIDDLKTKLNEKK